MTQLLSLIKKADRNAPAVYQLGKNERLNVHFEDSYADITDANTGAYIRMVGWDGLREWGYSPAKLLAGNTTDQFIDKNDPNLVYQFKSGARHIMGGLALSVVLAAIGNITGCTNYLADQLNTDVKTSTTYPRIAANSAHSDIDLKVFREQTAYANKKLREMNMQARSEVSQ